MPGILQKLLRRVTTTGVVAALLVASILSQARAADGTAFFEAKIRPVLVKRCYRCHAGLAQGKGGLKLDNKARLRMGGSSGSPIDLEHPEDSLLLAALRYEGPSMPPSGKLADETIADFAQWIKMGAPDPRDDSTKNAVSVAEINFEDERKAWAYTAPKPHVPPEVREAGWPRGSIDRFVLSRQEAAGVRPGPDAPPAVWLRRVAFDLVGLPPTPDQVEEILHDDSAEARAAVVDRLLASPAFGERWGRHWMDVARFAESSGSDKNFLFPQAWRYRDWVIDAFNADMPYNMFVQLQVAGDLEPAASPADSDAQITATGFLALVPRVVDERVRELYFLNVVDEQIDNIGRGVLGLSVSCARCHDHKFDPIPTTDYYALAGILRSSETRDGMINRQRSGGETNRLIALATAPKDQSEAIQLATVEATKAEKAWAERRKQLTSLQQRALEIKALAKVAASGPSEPVPQALATEDQIKAMDQEVRALATTQDEKKSALARLTAHTLVAGVIDRAEPVDVSVRIRGEIDLIGPSVPRGYLNLLARPDDPRPDPTGSGRRELAAWLTRPENPLTARVIVNRLWSKLFGAGIVATVDDFGSQGSKPTHPELLDHLATQFVADGWSMKRMIREMVLSRTYGVAVWDDSSNQSRDANNTLLWRWNRKRLDAEALRDAMLAASGRLERSRPLASPAIALGVQELNRRTLDLKPVTDFTPLESLSRARSVYLPVVRNKLTEPMAAFDVADPNLIVGRRDATTNPSQGLYVLNSQFVLDQAEQFARGLLSGTASDDTARIDRAFMAMLARRPTPEELACATRYLSSTAKDEVLEEGTGIDAERLSAWTSFAQAMMALPEFRFIF
jgi:cytochrome c553